VQGEPGGVEGVPAGRGGLEAGLPGVQARLVDRQHLPGVGRPHRPDQHPTRRAGPGRLDDRRVQAAPGAGSRGDGDLGESGRQELAAVLSGGHGAGGAAGPLLGCRPPGRVGAGDGDDVADPEPPAGPQHPERLRQRAGLVRGQVDDTVGDHRIDVAVGQRDVLDAAVQELSVRRARGGGVSLGQLDHLRGGVQAVGLPSEADAAGGQQHVDPAPGPQVQDSLAGPQPGDRHRVAAAQAGSHRGLGQPADVVVGGGPEAAPGGRIRIAVGDLLAAGNGPGQLAVSGGHRGADLPGIIGHRGTSR
jgi:hypothetical protein